MIRNNCSDELVVVICICIVFVLMLEQLGLILNLRGVAAVGSMLGGFTPYTQYSGYEGSAHYT